MNRRVSAWLTVVIGVGAVLAITGLILRATIEVRHGHGDEIYVNAQGMQVHWIDVLTMSAAAFIAILVLIVATLLFERRTKRDAAAIKRLDATKGASPADQGK